MLAKPFILSLLSGACFLCSPSLTQAAQQPLQAGQFEWAPERAPKGPVLVVVSLDDQMAYVYRNGVQIGRSTVSTGREGKETPTGVFTILQRKKKHESNIYKGAKMPYMQRLTWTGIAMHAGKLPGYPASAGCIRLPYDFSEKLYSTTRNGSTVVITEKAATPAISKKPASILLESRGPADSKPVPKGHVVWEPQKSPEGPVNLLLSYADKTLYVFRNGILIGQSPAALTLSDDMPQGIFLMLEGLEAGSAGTGRPVHPWSMLALHGGSPDNAVERLRQSIQLPQGFGQNIQQIIAPGTILLATNDPSTEATRSDGPMNVLTPEEKKTAN
ncbi:L,D-transpeptidase family protein [Rubritalea tangerina]|uniref:L,D-transpeptidase family protein n=2 Tax=Rubritalea tangerina TaxID=430798 RepID=A0ABW4Z9Y9_9BACT